MTLAAQIAADVSRVFFNTNDFAVNVTYSRGAASVPLVAIVAPQITDNIPELSAGVTRIEKRSYLIEASKLILSGSLTLPQIGDTITEGTNVFIVPKSNNQPRNEYADENRLTIRVNTTLKTGS